MRNGYTNIRGRGTDQRRVTSLQLVSVGLLLAICLIAIPLYPVVASKACPSLQERPFGLKQLTAGLYVRKGKHETFKKENLNAIANIGFIIGNKSIAVIDTGGSYCDGQRFLKALRKVSSKPISHIINTHVHPDHLFGNAAFQGEGATIIGHENLPQAVREKGRIYLENLTRIVGKDVMNGTKAIPPDKTVKDKMTVNLGNRPLTLMAMATAHTDQDLVVYDETTKTLWSGDLVFHEHTPVVDGSLLGWLKVTDILSKIPADYLVPGHGGPMLKWPEGGKDQNRYLSTLTKDLREIINDGGTMLEAQKKAAISEKEKWKLFEEFNPRNASTAFQELEWE